MAASTPSGMRDRIFISYRRDDARGASGRVWDWLRIGFGRERVFRDVASIGAGKWRDKIDQALAASTACVAVIGRRWADDINLPRLKDPTDMIRYELETALASGEQEDLTVIPLLVEDAQLRDIPKDELPESLRPLLADWNVLELRESGWDEDTRRLIEMIASATGLAVNPELEDWMALMMGGLSRMTRHNECLLNPGSLRGEVQALVALLHQAAGAGPAERPALKAAMEALARGNTRLAEQAFELEMEKSHRLRDVPELVAANAEQMAVDRCKQEADAARNVGNLAVIRGDLEKACAYFERALAANPGDLETAYELGGFCIARADLKKAQNVFEAMIEKAIAMGQKWQEGQGLIGLGDVRMKLGNYLAALTAYQECLAIAEDLAKRDPVNPTWQDKLYVIHDKIGNACRKQGDAPGALAAYEARMAIRDAKSIRNRLISEEQDW
jgi:tetratricopeptide (TPR) repeat protein